MNHILSEFLIDVVQGFVDFFPISVSGTGFVEKTHLGGLACADKTGSPHPHQSNFLGQTVLIQQPGRLFINDFGRLGG